METINIPKDALEARVINGINAAKSIVYNQQTIINPFEERALAHGGIIYEDDGIHIRVTERRGVKKLSPRELAELMLTYLGERENDKAAGMRIPGILTLPEGPYIKESHVEDKLAFYEGIQDPKIDRFVTYKLTAGVAEQQALTYGWAFLEERTYEGGFRTEEVGRVLAARYMNEQLQTHYVDMVNEELKARAPKTSETSTHEVEFRNFAAQIKRVPRKQTDYRLFRAVLGEALGEEHEGNEHVHTRVRGGETYLDLGHLLDTLRDVLAMQEDHARTEIRHDHKPAEYYMVMLPSDASTQLVPYRDPM